MAHIRISSHRCRCRALRYAGVALRPGSSARETQTTFNYWLGKIGDAQVGPIYLGFTGVASAILLRSSRSRSSVSTCWRRSTGARSSSSRTSAGSRLSRRSRNTACSFPPLTEGGWWLMTGFFLTTSIILWWIRTYRRSRALGMGTHVSWAFASAIFLYPVARLHPAVADGHLERSAAVRHLPASRLDQQLLDQVRQPLLQPLPLSLDRVPVRLGPAVRHARCDHSRGEPLRRRA